MANYTINMGLFIQKIVEIVVLLYFCSPKTENTMAAKVHIGNMIRVELTRQGRTMTWFANAIHSDRSNTYKMLKRESIDLSLLMYISELLHYDFLRECSEALSFGPENEHESQHESQ